MQRAIEFWTLVRQLAQSYDDQGALSDERAAKIIAAFEQLPPDTQRQLLTAMLRIATDMPDIYHGGFGSECSEQRQFQAECWLGSPLMNTIPIRADIDLTNELIRQNRAVCERAVNARITFHLTRAAVQDARSNNRAAKLRAAQCLSDFTAFSSQVSARSH